MRSSQILFSVLERVRAAGLETEATIIEDEARRVRTIELALEAVLDSADEEPIIFPARRVRPHPTLVAAE